MDRHSLKEKLKWYIPPFSFIAFLVIFWIAIFEMEDKTWSFITQVVAFIVLLPAQIDIMQAIKRNKKHE